MQQFRSWGVSYFRGEIGIRLGVKECRKPKYITLSTVVIPPPGGGERWEERKPALEYGPEGD